MSSEIFNSLFVFFGVQENLPTKLELGMNQCRCSTAHEDNNTKNGNSPSMRNHKKFSFDKCHYSVNVMKSIAMMQGIKSKN